MSQLTTNTTTIDELITIANNLPDAGSGGSGGVETCTVTLAGEASEMCYTKYVDGVFSGDTMMKDVTVSAEVVKNTVVTVMPYTAKYRNYTITGDATFIAILSSSAHMFFVTGDCTISIN